MIPNALGYFKASEVFQIRRTSVSKAPLALSVLQASQRKPVPVGIELYAVRGELGKDLLGTVSAVAKMGYQVVEFYSPYLQWTTDTAKEARRRLDALGITCRSTHNGANAFSGDNLKKAIELNQILGSTTMVLASPPPKLVDVASWRNLGARMTEAVGTLRPLGMTAGFHNHRLDNYRKLRA